MTLAEFKLLYPEFNQLPEELIEVNLEKSIAITSEKFWQQYYNEAVGLTTAHEITLRREEQLNTEMKLSMIRGGKSFSESRPVEYFKMTSYGQRLIELKKRLPKTGFVL